MYRTITEQLKQWKDSPRRKPLLLTGVRQCGKTYVVREFGETLFKNLVYINFEKQPQYVGVFDYNLDPERIVREIAQISGTDITPGETLVFFDEIQECPKAITSLKYFCEDMRELHVIGAGSLLGVALKKEPVSFPVGKVQRAQMYPMDFREFVIANGAGNLVEALKDWPVSREIPVAFFVPMEKLLKEYYAVGGMPEAVKTWTETRDYDAVDDVLQEIISDYRDDISKHAPVTDVPKIRWIWDSIPLQLAKDNNKFVFSHVKEGKRAHELENALQWLKDAGLIYQLELVEKPEIPLSGFADASFFKVYLADVGLLRSVSGITAETLANGSGQYLRFKGAFTENYVMTQLVAMGKRPYYWRSGNTAEVDFLFEDDGEIVPVEVKAAENTQAKSYRQFCSRYEPKVGFKLSLKNIAENECVHTRTISLPLFMIRQMDQYM